jgi:preprotein translocase subunit Sec63
MAKEKTVELKPKVEKISEEHLKQLQGVVNRINTMQFNIGKIESQKHSILHNLQQTQNQVAQFQNLLQEEYGSFDVNIEDGTINWPKEGEDKEDEK